VREAGLEGRASVELPKEVDDDDDVNDGSVEIPFTTEPPVFNVITPEPDDFAVPDPAPVALRPAQHDQGGWGYIDSVGEYAIEPKFQLCGSFSEGLAWAQPKRSANWGFIDRSGEFVIEPHFSHGGEFHDGRARVQVNATRWSYITRDGHLICEPQFHRADDFSEGLAAAADKDDSTGTWGYIDRMGQIVIPPQYDATQPFRHGLALVHGVGKLGDAHFFPSGMGYIDRTGTWIFSWASPMSVSEEPALPPDRPLFDNRPPATPVPPPAEPPPPNPYPVEPPPCHPDEGDGMYSPHLPVDYERTSDRALPDAPANPAPSTEERLEPRPLLVAIVVAVVAAILFLVWRWLG